VQEKEGLFIGPSAALNLVGAVKVARKLGPGHTVVTILCDGGDRYMSKLFNKKWLEKQGLTPTKSKDLNFVQYSPILSSKKA
jgi:cysteine synthase A